MEISKEQLFQAATVIGLSEDNKKALWETLEAQNNQSSSISKLLYYFGALIVISAMTWFMGLGWKAFGGGAIFLISLLYAILFTLAGAKLWKKEGLKIPAGLLITMAVCMTPLAIYGLLPHYSVENRIFMEIGTILVGLIALRYYPFPFLTAPIFFAAWFLSMDIDSVLFRSEGALEQRGWISLIFGLFVLLIAYIIDLKKKAPWGFWAYLFGTLTFWGGLSALSFNRGEIVLFLYLLINITMMVKSILLKRKVLMVFGALGTFLYFSHLAYDLFENSIFFPFVLTFLGLVVIYLGVLYQKNSQRIEKKMNDLIPKKIKKFFPFTE